MGRNPKQSGKVIIDEGGRIEPDQWRKAFHIIKNLNINNFKAPNNRPEFKPQKPIWGTFGDALQRQSNLEKLRDMSQEFNKGGYDPHFIWKE